MATNPQYPDEPSPREVERHPDIHGRVQVPRKRRFPWPLLTLIIAAALLAALIAWLPSVPHRHLPPSGAQVPQQPTASQVQLSNLHLQPSPAGAAFYLGGIVQNNGSTDITGMQVEADFKGSTGQTLETETRPAEQVTPNQTAAVENFSNAPIKPGESRPFRLYFDHYPEGWNKQIPQLRITAVTGTTP
jgi:hypothetical protein